MVSSARREAAERRLGLVHVDPLGDLDPEQAQPPVGQRAGLVDADRVDRGEALGRAHLLHQRVLARQPHGGDGEGDAHQQHQALGDQRHQARGRGLRRLDQVGPPQLEGEQQEQRQRHHRPGAGDDHTVDLALQR
jgi:hypothetical protein